MRLKSLALAAATVVSLAAPAAALAQPYGGYHDHREWREHRRYWRDHDRYAHRRYWRGPRCRTEMRGHYNWRGDYVHRPVRICYR
jgi:hypothetical protein